VSHSNRFITDDQWDKISEHVPPRANTGRPRCDDRKVLEGILWVLKTGARWRDLPKEYPSASTCWRRLHDWEELEVWETIWEAFLQELDTQGLVDWEEAFVDASFFPAKKGATESAKPNAAKERSAWWVADGQGLPLSCQLTSASPLEVTLLEDAVDHLKIRRPWGLKLIADRAYDSDKHGKKLKHKGFDLTVPHRKGRVQPKNQDGRKLRRYKHRWKIERTFAWFGSFRRRLVRHEHHLTLYHAFFIIACIMQPCAG